MSEWGWCAGVSGIWQCKCTVIGYGLGEVLVGGGRGEVHRFTDSNCSVGVLLVILNAISKPFIQDGLEQINTIHTMTPFTKYRTP